jgi:hypothetical protein
MRPYYFLHDVPSFIQGRERREYKVGFSILDLLRVSASFGRKESLISPYGPIEYSMHV